MSLQSPAWPQLESLVGQALPPTELLLRLSQRGVHLLPEDRDAEFAGVVTKDDAAERAFCEDLPLLRCEGAGATERGGVGWLLGRCQGV